MVTPLSVFGVFGFVFGLWAFARVSCLEKRVKQLEQPDEESKDVTF